MKTIYLSGDFGWEITADKFREKINPQSKEKLRVIINSSGGSVRQGFEISNIIQSYKGEVEIVIGVMAASIAFYVAMSVPYENRKGLKNSSIMTHEVSAGVWGRSRDFKIVYEMLEGFNNIIADAYSEALEIKREEARTMMAEDYYLIGWEALVDKKIISDVLEFKDLDIPEFEKDDEWQLIFSNMSNDMKKSMEFEQIKALMIQAEEREMENMKTGFQEIKAAARLKNFTPETIPDENKTRGVNSMSKLQDFLTANPEAKAEHDKALESAEAKGDAKVVEAAAALDSDRKRIVTILSMAKAQLTPEVAKALEEGTQPGDYAIAELERQKNLQANAGANQGVFGALVPKQTPAEQGANALKADEDAKAKADADFDAKATAAAKKAAGKEV